MRHENSSVLELDGKEVSVFTPSKPREKWLRKRTHVKLRVTAALLLFIYYTYQTLPFFHHGTEGSIGGRGLWRSSIQALTRPRSA